jgi:hypothetical protein
MDHSVSRAVLFLDERCVLILLQVQSIVVMRYTEWYHLLYVGPQVRLPREVSCM